MFSGSTATARSARSDLSALTDRAAAACCAVFQPLTALGGCDTVQLASTVQLYCNSDLSESALIQGLAPGAYGSLCDFCPASCNALNPGICECEADSSPPTVQQEEKKSKKKKKKVRSGSTRLGY